MNKTLTAVVGGLAAIALLGACGDDKKSSSGGGNDYCARIVAFKAKSEAFNPDFTNGAPEDLKAAFNEMAAALHDMEKGAPAEIAADVTVEADYIDAMIEILDKYEWDVAASMSDEDYQRLSEINSDTAVADANDHLKAYSEETCGISSATTSA